MKEARLAKDVLEDNRTPLDHNYPDKFEYKGLTFISNEQFIKISKTKTFNDEETTDKIINIHNQFSSDGSTYQNKLCFHLIGAFKRGEVKLTQIINDKEAMDAWDKVHERIKELGNNVANYNDEEYRFITISAKISALNLLSKH